MRLTDFIRYQESSTKTAGNVINTSEQSSSNAMNQYRLYSQLKSMMPGDTILGEIVSMDGNEIQLLLNESNILNARLDSTMNLTVGQNVLFEVSGNGGGQVSLRALFTNVAQQQTVMRALDEAGLSQSPENIRTVSLLIRDHRPIDKQSLQLLFKDIALFPNADSEDIITLHELKMPVNDENIRQIENYRSVRHQIANETQSLIELANTALTEASTPVSVSESIQVYKAILQALLGDNEGATQTPVFNQGGTVNNEENTMKQGEPISGDNSIVQVVLNTDENTDEQSGQAINTRSSLHDAVPTNNLRSYLSLFSQEGVSDKEVLQSVLDIIMKEPNNEIARDLLKSDGFRKVLKNELLNKILITPADVEQPDNIQELYTRLQKQTNNIVRALDKILPKENPIVQMGTQINENIDFISQMNKVFNYIQLPLNMSGHPTTGDLYVYRRNKAFAENEEVSAFLHLDMKNLGNLDIYVKMKDKDVSTHFMVENDEVLDFIESNISMLDERLAKRGYHIITSIDIQKEKKNVLSEIMSDTIDSIPGNSANMDIKLKYGFDVRA